MRARLPAGEESTDLAYTYAITPTPSPSPSCREAEFTTMSPCSSTWCPRHDCARTHMRTHAVIVVQWTVNERAQHACMLPYLNPAAQPPCAPLMQEQGPWLLPSPFTPRAFLGAHATRASDILPPGQAGRQGWPSPPLDHGKHRGPHIREGQPVNLISLDVTSRALPLPLVFALTGPIGSLLLRSRTTASPHHPTTQFSDVVQGPVQ